MATFDELMKDKKVASHPLLKGYHRLAEARKAQHTSETPAYGMQENENSMDNGDLNDIFSMRNIPVSEKTSTDFRGMVFEASRAIQDVLSQFMLPIFPKISYNNSRDVKYARDSQTDIIGGVVLFNVDFISKSGVRKKTVVPVKVHQGKALPPSVMTVEGRMYTVSQDALDMVLERVTSYELPELRTMYEPPLNREERELAIGLRNQMGIQPRDNTQNYMTPTKEGSIDTPPGWQEVLDEIGDAEEKGIDTFPRPWLYLLRNYILNYVSTASRDAWEGHLINRGIAVNPWGGNRVRKTHSKEGQMGMGMGMGMEDPMEKEMELEVSAPPMEMEEVIEEVIQHMYPGTRTPVESGDGVKFPGNKGQMRGNIVEVNPEEDTLIVKSKGMEYRIKVDEIEPMPSTFKKMYM